MELTFWGQVVVKGWEDHLRTVSCGMASGMQVCKNLKLQLRDTTKLKDLKFAFFGLLPATTRGSLTKSWKKSSANWTCSVGISLSISSFQPGVFLQLKQRLVYINLIKSSYKSHSPIMFSGQISIISKMLLPTKCREYGSRDLDLWEYIKRTNFESNLILNKWMSSLLLILPM